MDRIDALRKLLELLPVIQQGPPWLRAVVVLWLVASAAAVVAVAVAAIGAAPPSTTFAIALPDGHVADARQIALHGTGLAPADTPRFAVYRLERGIRTRVPQPPGELLRRGAEWRWEWIAFDAPGTHEITGTVRRAGRVVSFVDPIRVEVARPAPDDAAPAPPPTSAPATCSP